MTVQEALRLGIGRLREVGIDDPARDARLLMAACLGVERDRLTLVVHDEFDPLVEAKFFAAIGERQQNRPMSHLLGYRDFYGHRFSVSSDVLDPRGDTETLVAAALEVPFDTVLDLGTGSGCIVTSLLAQRVQARGVGSDLSQAALSIAEKNAQALGVAERCRFLHSDWLEAVEGLFDLIVSNPPYIAADEMDALQPELSFEPRMALTDEGDGLSAYLSLIAEARAYLRPSGWLMVEIGHTQGKAIEQMFHRAGFASVKVLTDLDGRDRVVVGQNPA